jgi:hypothetical protein
VISGVSGAGFAAGSSFFAVLASALLVEVPAGAFFGVVVPELWETPG